MCEEAGWWWPMHGAVVLTDRPTTINRDKEGRLHSGDGPTLAYADGYELYSWHGTRVPADLIGGWTIPQIVAERNTEVRRCAVERMGWDVFLAEADATLVAEADDQGKIEKSYIWMNQIPVAMIDHDELFYIHLKQS